MTDLPVCYDHLLRLSDDIGIFEHAEGSEPRRHHGYCLDDAARALVVACREPSPAPAMRKATGSYLSFVRRAQSADGSCRNRLGLDGHWTDLPATGDWWGRSLWGLGTAVARAPDPAVRAIAARHFTIGARARSPWSRAMAFAALGAGEILAVDPGHPAAHAILVATPAAIGPLASDESWPWPEDRLRYANAAVAEALLIVGVHLDDAGARRDGLRLLGWLLQLQTADGHLSPTPAAGRGPGDPAPGWDQQPIEVAALADACARALAVTGDDRWLTGLTRCVDWFAGDNDSTTVMWDPVTGAGFDGLEPDGRNENQGAESTLAALATLQLAARHGLVGSLAA